MNHKERVSPIKHANALNTEGVGKPCQCVLPQATLLSPIPKPPAPPPMATKSQLANMAPSVVKNIEKGSKVNIWMEKKLSY